MVTGSNCRKWTSSKIFPVFKFELCWTIHWGVSSSLHPADHTCTCAPSTPPPSSWSRSLSLPPPRHRPPAPVRRSTVCLTFPPKSIWKFNQNQYLKRNHVCLCIFPPKLSEAKTLRGGRNIHSVIIRAEHGQTKGERERERGAGANFSPYAILAVSCVSSYIARKLKEGIRWAKFMIEAVRRRRVVGDRNTIRRFWLQCPAKIDLISCTIVLSEHKQHSSMMLPYINIKDG